jgi:hypothetical protein
MAEVELTRCNQTLSLSSGLKTTSNMGMQYLVLAECSNMMSPFTTFDDWISKFIQLSTGQDVNVINISDITRV